MPGLFSFRLNRFGKNSLLGILMAVIIFTGTIGPVGVQEANAQVGIGLRNFTARVLDAGANAVGSARDWAGKAVSVGADKLGGLAAEKFLQPILNFGIRASASLTGIWLSFTGTMLDLSIAFTSDGSNIQFPSVLTGWQTVRDVANMFFIFIFLYIGISTILQLNTSGMRQTLVRLILVAIFVNFSWFFSGVVIDASNVVGNVFYNNIQTFIPGDQQISEYFIERLKLQTLYQGKQSNLMASFIAIFIIGIVNIIAGFIFLSMALMFFMRNIVLMFVLILAPLAFLAAVLNSTNKYFRQWVDTLVNQSMVFPVFTLLLYVIVVIMDSDNVTSNLNATDDQGAPASAVASFEAFAQFNDVEKFFATNTLEVFGIFVPYIIYLGMLILAMNVSKQIAGSTGKYAAVGAAAITGVGIGATALAGRQIGGTTGRWVRDSRTVQNLAARGGWSGRVGKTLKGSANYAATASWDARKGVSGSMLSAAGGTMGVNQFGKAGGKGGHAQAHDDRIKADEKRIDALGKADAVTSDQYRKAREEANRETIENDPQYQRLKRQFDAAKQAQKDTSFQSPAYKMRSEQAKKAEDALKKFTDGKAGEADTVYKDKVTALHKAAQDEGNRRKRQVQEEFGRRSFSPAARAASQKSRTSKNLKKEFEDLMKKHDISAAATNENTDKDDSASGGGGSGGSSDNQNQTT